MIEIIPKPAEKGPIWPNILLAFSVLILICVIAGYFLLDSFIKTEKETLKEKEKIARQLRSSEDQELERDVLQYKKKIDDFTILLNQHKISSEFFVFLEEIIHPQVKVSDLDLNVKDAQVKISGEAEKIALGQQLLIFQENEKVLKSDISALKREEGELVLFSIVLSLDPEIFKFLK